MPYVRAYDLLKFIGEILNWFYSYNRVSKLYISLSLTKPW